MKGMNSGRWIRSVCSALLVFVLSGVPAFAAGQGYNPRTDRAVHYSLRTTEKKIALTFDDGPLPGKTEAILDVLRENGVRATFFMVGSQVEANPALSRRVAEEGHEIGNHTFTHNGIRTEKKEELCREIEKTEAAISEACGKMPALFRPPTGWCSATVSAAAKENGYEIVMWSVDTEDWKGRSADAIVGTVLETVRPGAIVLMHDGIYRESHTAEALSALIPRLRAEGYEFVTAGELIEAVMTEE